MPSAVDALLASGWDETRAMAMQQPDWLQIGRWWQSLGPWAASCLRIGLVLLLAWLLIALLQRAIRAFRERLAKRLEDREAVQRADTLARVFRYSVKVLILLLAGTVILSELGVSVAPILGAAGVVGVALGFGAQSLVRDFLAGFFLLLEDQIRRGDVVTLDAHAGMVEEITLRYVRLRDYDGRVHFVPNGSIGAVINQSRGFAQAVIEIGVAYESDLDQVMQVMCEVAQVMRADPVFAARMLDGIELAGVENWADSAIMIRGRIKVVALEQWSVRREYLRRLKYAFDAHGIEIPYPRVEHRTLTAKPAPVAPALD